MPDLWHQWLMHHRFGDDPEYKRIAQIRITDFADSVLDNAQITCGSSLLDVGAGDGLAGFRALERCHGDLKVTFFDISGSLLDVARGTANARGYNTQCRFVEGTAENMGILDDSSMDIVVARASIAYVQDKAAAFREMFRVLKPGGRLSIAEPILQEEAFAARIFRQRRDSTVGVGSDPLLELMHLWKSAQYPDTEEEYAKTPLVNFSEQDLLKLARRAGFCPLHLRFHVDVIPALITSWDVFLATSPHPLAPTLKEIMQRRFTTDQRQQFERLIRPTVESGKNLDVDRVAYLFGQKPNV